MSYFWILSFIILFSFVFLLGYLKLSFVEKWAKRVDIWAKEKKQEYESRGNENNKVWHKIRQPFAIVALWLSTVTKKHISSIYWRSTIFVSLIVFAFISIVFLIFIALYVVFYIVMMIISLWIMYKIFQIITFFLEEGKETTSREELHSDVSKDETEHDDTPPIMSPGAKKTQLHKSITGAIYSEDNKGNRFYKRNGIMTGEYWEDSKGNTIRKNKGILGEEYWEDNKNNIVHKCNGLLGGEYYEDSKGNVMNKDGAVLEQNSSKKYSKK